MAGDGTPPWCRCAPVPAAEAQAWSALVTGVRDYIGKNGFPGVIIGLSGGVDSALVLAIAVDALGADRVRAVMMPSPYTADISWIDAREMARRLGVRYDEIAIAPMFDAFRASLAPQFAGLAEDTTEENIQARIRGTLLMALSNKIGSHRADHRQQERDGHRLLHAVRRHGRRLRGHQGRGQDAGLPARALEERAAHAARRRQPGTGDSRAHHHAPAVGRTAARTRPTRTACRPTRCSTRSWRATWKTTRASRRSSPPAIARADVERVTRLIKLNEYKRRQAPVGIRITHRGFGRDWRYPITSKFRA